VILVSVATAWTTLVVVGWALIYLPQLPAGFLAAPGLPDASRGGLLTAFYLSLASVTTLSASDLTPLTPFLRFATTLEALVGLVLFTAWITWVLSIYPVIAKRRSFEREVSILRTVYRDPRAAVAEAPREAITELMRSLTEQIVCVATDLQQSRVSYYFQNESQDLTLGNQLPYVMEIAAAASESGPEPGIRHHGQLLSAAVKALLCDIGEQYLGLHDPPPELALKALARDHMLRGSPPGA
jgi:hypothetical protein